MLTMVNKKIITILIVVLVVAAAVGAYMYFSKNPLAGTPVQRQETAQQSVNENSTNPAQNSGDTVQVSGGVQAQGTNGGGTLTVCRDECGNGACQAVDKNCTSSSLDCICAEDHASCPQDCK